MVQLFRDRMRRDGVGYGGLFVWTQMIIDLVRSAYSEHRREPDMTKKMWIGSVLVALVLIGTVGVGTLMAQSEGEVAVVSVWRSSQTFQGSADDGVAGVMRQAVEEGTISQESADEIVRAFEELPADVPPSSKDSSLDGKDSSGMRCVSGAETMGLISAILQAVEEDAISQIRSQLPTALMLRVCVTTSEANEIS